MHDKLLIADGRAAVIGGRNIGDHYFGLNEVYNFHDTDLLGIGHIGAQANDMFDKFWNSEWVVSAQNLTTESDEKTAEKQWQQTWWPLSSAICQVTPPGMCRWMRRVISSGRTASNTRRTIRSERHEPVDEHVDETGSERSILTSLEKDKKVC
jgi:phosphatidylserine/phosphatidylglycerophosphate/cardiolipin synthase-like enzyme